MYALSTVSATSLLQTAYSPSGVKPLIVQIVVWSAKYFCENPQLFLHKLLWFNAVVWQVVPWRRVANRFDSACGDKQEPFGMKLK